MQHPHYTKRRIILQASALPAMPAKRTQPPRSTPPRRRSGRPGAEPAPRQGQQSHRRHPPPRKAIARWRTEQTQPAKLTPHQREYLPPLRRFPFLWRICQPQPAKPTAQATGAQGTPIRIVRETALYFRAIREPEKCMILRANRLTYLL